MQGRPFGHLTMALQGSDAEIAGALTAIRAVAEVTEVA
ncbi:NIL domain-containing protein [Ornithinimicrobium sp. INDO-MA30-4]|nr:NIL domain-containing protein [Ornithinimicrobium sp. INDO-MA30-4]